MGSLTDQVAPKEKLKNKETGETGKPVIVILKTESGQLGVQWDQDNMNKADVFQALVASAGILERKIMEEVEAFKKDVKAIDVPPTIKEK